MGTLQVRHRNRKSPFVRLFDKTPPGVKCPHFYELILSNGCPYDCSYCYLRLTFRGDKSPTLFLNGWEEVRGELEARPGGVFVSGELADSLAVVPPLLEPALRYFARQQSRVLLLVTKSTNVDVLLQRDPTPQVVVAFSVNAPAVAARYERRAPRPASRLAAAAKLKLAGYRVRVRLDPIILDAGLPGYQDICRMIAALGPEMVTLGSLRQFPSLTAFAPDAPRLGLERAPDGRMRYAVERRVELYQQIGEWLGLQPALCKETDEVWERLGWRFRGCNCTWGNQ